MIRFYGILLTSLLFTTIDVNARQLNWQLGNYGFFHNQEYFNPYIEPQTMGGARLYGIAGFKTDNNNAFYAGGNYLYEFGGEPNERKIAPVIYYQFENKNITFAIGSFPRYGKIVMPKLLLTDTVSYYRPNTEGIFLEGRQSWGFHNVWLDWTSRQTDVRRETFSLGATGQLNFGPIFYRHHFIMFHYAGPAIPIPNDHIRDNGGGLTGLGIDLTQNTSLDTLSIYAAYATSYDQHRDVYDIRFYHGLYLEIHAEYRRFGLRNIFYKGDGQVQLLGDSFYTAKRYNRTDVYWQAFKNDRVLGIVEFGFHTVPSILDLHQKFTVRINLEGKKQL